MLRDYPQNLFTLLGGSWQLEVSESLTRLCPPILCPREPDPARGRVLGLASDLAIVYAHLLLPDGLKQGLPPIDQNWANFGEGSQPWRHRNRSPTAVDRATEFDAFIAGIEADEAPTLHFLHTRLPHAPYDYLPSGRYYSANGRIMGLEPKDRCPLDEEHVALYWQRHLLQLGFVDRLVGKLLDRLGATGMLDESLLVVKADHGISMKPGGARRRASLENAHEIMPIPLFIKRPGQVEGDVDARALESVDLLPTLAELLAVRLPKPVDGRSLAKATTEGRRELRLYPSHEKGGYFTLAPEQLEEGAAVVRQMVELFGSGRDSGPGPVAKRSVYPELLGRRASELDIVLHPGLRLDLVLPSLTAEFDSGLDFVPAHIYGHIGGVQEEPPLTIAIAVNGTIAAVARSFDSERGDAEHSWSAVLGEANFQPGENEIRAYWVTESVVGRT